MKIKTRLQIAVISTLIISVTVGLFIFSAYREMNEYNQKEITTGRVSQNMAELKIITHEYLLHPGERSLMQWKASHDSLVKLLAEEVNIFEDLGKKNALEKTLKSLERVSDIFAELVTISEEEREYGEHHKNGVSELKVKLTGDLLVESQAMVSRVFLANQAIQAKLVSAQRKAGLSIVILLTGLAVFVLALFLWISKSIGAPITRLEEGIRIIGGGNFDHRVGTYAKDEIGQLSRAFDGMMEDLKKSTISIDDLNREIGARKKTEAVLRESEERARQYLDIARVAFVALDKKGDLTLINQRGLEILGYKEEELLGRNWFETCLPERARRDVLDVYHQLIRGEIEPVECYENTVLTKDGKERIIAWHNSVLRNPDGEIVGTLTSGEDITASKQAEEEIKSHQEHIALINQILRHDITNDLVVIQSALNLYNNSPEEELLKEIFSRTEKSIDLINRMRGLETFMSRHREMNMYEMRDTIDEVIKNYPSIDFEIEGKARVMADDSLSSVIDNIVRNAVIHGKADRITITTVRERDMCEVRIADNGSGIPNDVKERIFEEGFMHGDTGHTGIGLHIVKKAMENYGSYAYVEDNEPKGTVFVLRFRMVK